MLSLQTLREETDRVRESCALRGVDVSIDRVLDLDDERRAVLADVERMRADRNQAGKLIGAAKDDEERQRLIDAQRAVADELDALEERLRETQSVLDELLLEIPNLPHVDVPLGVARTAAAPPRDPRALLHLAVAAVFPHHRPCTAGGVPNSSPGTLGVLLAGAGNDLSTRLKCPVA